MFEISSLRAVIWPESWRRDAKRDDDVIFGWKTSLTSSQLPDDRGQLIKPRVKWPKTRF